MRFGTIKVGKQEEAIGIADHKQKPKEKLTPQQQDALLSGRVALADMPLPRRQKWQAFLKLAFARVGDANLGLTAAGLAYYALLSLFPLILVTANALPFLGLSYQGLTRYLAQAIPANVMNWLNPVIENLLDSTSSGWLGVGALATLYAASLGINGLKLGFNQIYGVEPSSNFIIQRLLAMVMTFFLIIVLGAVLIAFTFGRQFLEWLVPTLGIDDRWVRTFNTLRWPVTVLALFVIIMLLNYFLPNVKIKLRTILPGTAFTVAGWLLISQGFSLYMKYFGTRYLSYGTIGTFIAIMLWLNFSALTMLWGALINALTAEYFNGHLHQSRGKVHDFVKKRVGQQRA